MNIKIHHNPRCSKSRQTLTLLEKETTDFKIIEYLKNPLSFDEILSIKPIDLVRKNEQIWKYNYTGKEITNVEIITAMEKPKLIERPVVIGES